MSHVPSPHWLDAVGFAAGAVGVCIAVWLQMVAPRRVRARYVAGFLVLGGCLMLVNLRLVWPEPVAATSARLLAYSVLIVGQGWLAKKVHDEAGPDVVTSAIESLEDLGGDR